MSHHRFQRPADPLPTNSLPVPAVLPDVVMTVGDDGAMTVTVNGDAYRPELFAPPWRRESFATLIDQLTERHQSPLRIEVREADGTVFTDIITSGRRRRPHLTLAHETAPSQPARTSTRSALIEIAEDGFTPGEDVAIAIIVTHTDASPAGTARALLTAEHAALTPTREAVLIGRISGTFTIRRLG